MNRLINLFRPSVVITFNGSNLRPNHVLTIAVKTNYSHGKKVNEKGAKYYILNDEGKIASDELSQSWDALNVWFKIFDSHEVIGTYDFTNEQIIKNEDNG